MFSSNKGGVKTLMDKRILQMLQIGEPHPDRNAQFEHINTAAAIFGNRRPGDFR
jgi:hypothetical protein